MNRCKTMRSSTLFHLLVVGLLAFPVSGCRSAGSGRVSLKAKAAYGAAVRDAEVVEEEEIFRCLKPVLPGEKGLLWSGVPGRSSLLVVTWTSWEGYDDFIGREMPVTRPVWVTLAPELREFCRHYYPRNRKGLIRRLEQWLGLPPGVGKTRFVELWVEIEDLLRPCPDPEITDRECSLDFVPGEPVRDGYRRWFEEQKKGTYGTDGYPWTRLGYTYDWGSPTTLVGPSEYLIWPAAQVRIHSVSKLRSFCRR